MNARVKNMRAVSTVTGHELLGDSSRKHERYTVYFDPPAAPTGVLRTTDLPRGIAQYCAQRARDGDLTFVFQGQLAGLPATAMWDSGAKKQFISRTFVDRHRLLTQPCSELVFLADGTPKQLAECVSVKLRIQGYSDTLTMIVTDLATGFDVLLGDTWGRARGVIADYGYD